MVLKRLRNYAIAAGIGLAALTGSAAKAEQYKPIPKPIETPIVQETGTETYDKCLEGVLIGTELLSSIIAATYIHETGHAKQAEQYGKTGNVYIGPEKIGNEWTLGHFTYRGVSPKLTAKQDYAVSAAGMKATRLTAETLDMIMNRGEFSPRIEQALATLYFMTRLETAKQVLVSSIPIWKGNASSSSDVQKISNYMLGRNKTVRKKLPNEQGKAIKKNSTGKEKSLYTGALGAIALETALDWNELERNLNKLLMRETYVKQKNYDIDLTLTPEGVYAAFTYNL